MSIDENMKPIRVFVHLAKGYGAPYREERWIGINERPPYGYFSPAAGDGCAVV
ncbi:MAG: hypothetical protein WBG11_03695 [Methylocella sp.]